MIPTPARPAQMRSSGINNMARAQVIHADALGGLISASADFIKNQQRVTETGELADFSETLDNIASECRDDLREQQPKDWDYAWSQMSTPRITEAIRALPESSRKAAAKMAGAFNQQASILARSDIEREAIALSRGKWEKQINAAVQMGDEERATAWVQAGQETFVGKDKLEERCLEVRDLSKGNRWAARIEQAPLEGLSALNQASPDELPDNDESKAQLRRVVEMGRRAASTALAKEFRSSMMQEQPIEMSSVTLAEKAGVLDSRQANAIKAQQASQEESTSPLASTRLASQEEYCRWMQRADELPQSEDDDEVQVSFCLDLASSPMSLSHKRNILQRVERGKSLVSTERRGISRLATKLYRSGQLGAIGDEASLRRLQRIQEEGLQILVERDAQEAGLWIADYAQRADRWVCYQDHGTQSN